MTGKTGHEEAKFVRIIQIISYCLLTDIGLNSNCDLGVIILVIC